MEHHGEPPKVERAHGYAAGRIRFTGQDAQLQLWPRIATKGIGRWRYVPDHTHAVLQTDEGTAPETLPLPNPTRVIATPAPTPEAARPAAPHSTLPVRRPFFGHAAELARVAACLAPEDRTRLYAETQGNPLLITWTLGQLGLDRGRCRTLEAAVAGLQEAQAGNDPLGFVFGDLVETFTADETAVLAALSHFTEPAQPDWLLPLTGLSRTAVETALDDLRDRALLIVDEDGDRWLLPALAARFLRRVQHEAVGETGERLADRADALAQENDWDQYDRFAVLDAAWAEVKAALPVLLAGDNRRLQGTCGALKDFLDFSGRWDD